jgi:hypothetical protein
LEIILAEKEENYTILGDLEPGALFKFTQGSVYFDSLGYKNTTFAVVDVSANFSQNKDNVYCVNLDKVKVFKPFAVLGFPKQERNFVELEQVEPLKVKVKE